MVLSSLVTGVMVSVSGTIGFVGLVIPHIARTIAGTAHRRMIPFAVLLGANLMIWANALARVVVAPLGAAHRRGDGLHRHALLPAAPAKQQVFLPVRYPYGSRKEYSVGRGHPL